MNKEIKTTSYNILSLVACAETYGFKDNVLFDAFAGMLGYKLTDEEIEAFSMKESKGDTEGYKNIKDTLEAFKTKYCN